MTTGNLIFISQTEIVGTVNEDTGNIVGELTASILNSISNTYQDYVLRINIAISAIDNAILSIQGSTDQGSTVISSGYSYANNLVNSAGAASQVASESEGSWLIASAIGGANNLSLPIIMDIKLYNLFDTTYKYYEATSDYTDWELKYSHMNGSGLLTSTESINSLYITMATGLMVGTFDFYGVEK